MNTARSAKYAGALIALAICAACSGASVTAPSTAALNYQYIGRTLSVNGRLVAAARLNPRPRHMTVVPDELPKAKKLQYFMGVLGTDIFDYPKSDKPIGQIMNAGGQGCTNVAYGYGNKTFWIVAAENQITEYRVPRVPIKTLSEYAGLPSSCAMDTSGDLAVGLISNGDIDIFKNASGSGTVMTTPLIEEFFDGYDNNGNLFADGFSSGGGFRLVELPKGSSEFEAITTSNTVGFPGSVQWDGTYLTVLDQEANAIYQYTVNGTKAALKGTVSLKGAGDCAQTWIVKGLVYCADAGNAQGEIFDYPAGGSATAILTTGFDSPLGVVAAQR